MRILSYLGRVATGNVMLLALAGASSGVWAAGPRLTPDKARVVAHWSPDRLAAAQAAIRAGSAKVAPLKKAANG